MTHHRFSDADGDCSCPSSLRDTVRLTLEGKQPECPRHNPPLADPANGGIALNDDAALAAIIGLPLARSRNLDDAA